MIPICLNASNGSHKPDKHSCQNLTISKQFRVHKLIDENQHSEPKMKTNLSESYNCTTIGHP